MLINPKVQQIHTRKIEYWIKILKSPKSRLEMRPHSLPFIDLFWGVSIAFQGFLQQPLGKKHLGPKINRGRIK